LLIQRGVPVATVAINNAVNAGLLAVRILGTAVPSLQEKLMDYRDGQEEIVMQKVKALEEVGWENYK
jgi:phosphoribosylcarboxyaminoimidazole (NCAIR) mutase